MKKIKKWRYYCDFCGKSGGSLYHMKNREEVCTKNKNRKCGFCRMAEFDQKTSDELWQFMFENLIESEGYEDNYGNGDSWQIIKKNIDEKKALKLLRDFVDGCPACMLTAMRLTESTNCFISFDCKKEKEQFYREFRHDCAHY